MKKLGLFFLLAMLFVSTLALAVSADEAYPWTEITEVEGMSDKATFGADGTIGAMSRVLMSDGKTYPAYYIFKDSTTLSVDFTEISKKSGATYTKANVIRIEIPNGITTLARLQSYTALLEVVIPEGVEKVAGNFLYELTTVNKVTLPSTIKSIASTAFYKTGMIENLVIPDGCTSVGEKAFKYSQIKSVVIPTSVETIDTEAFFECKELTEVVCGAAKIGSMAFKGCTALTRVTLENTKEISSQGFYGVGAVERIVIPEGCTTIGEKAFKSAGILSVTVPKSITSIAAEVFEACASLKSIYHYAEITGTRMYHSCSAVETLVIENLVNAETYSFYGLSGLKEISLPETLTTVGNYAFAKLGVEEITIPAAVITIGDSAFYSNPNLKRAVVLCAYYGKAMFGGCSNFTELVLSKNLAECAVTNTLNGASQNSFITYYCGSNPETLKTLMSSEMRVKDASFCTYSEYVSGNYTSSKYMVIYDANLCETVYGEHLEDNNLCVINCERCGWYGVAEKNPVHVQSVTMVYDSFDMAGKKVTFCTNEGCQYHDDVEASALFTFIGDSVPEFGIAGINLCYLVNDEAINEYKAVMGDTFEYGVFAVRESVIGNDDVLDEKGKFQEGVLGCNLSGNKYGAFELKISGFTTDEQKATKIVMGAYVVTGEDKKISYMQGGTPAEGQKYYSASYNDIVG